LKIVVKTDYILDSRQSLSISNKIVLPKVFINVKILELIVIKGIK